MRMTAILLVAGTVLRLMGQETNNGEWTANRLPGSAWVWTAQRVSNEIERTAAQRISSATGALWEATGALVDGATGAVNAALADYIDNAVASIPTVTGVPYWKSADGTWLATLDGGTGTLWRVASVDRITMTHDGAIPAPPWTTPSVYETNPGSGLNLSSNGWSLLFTDGGVGNSVGYAQDEELYQWVVTGGDNNRLDPLTNDTYGYFLFSVQFLTLTNLVTTFVTAQDLTNHLTRADFASASNALAQAAQAAYDLADDAYGYAEGLGATLNSHAADTGLHVTAEKQAAWDSKAPTNSPTFSGAVGLTNGTSFFAGVYLGTNGVAFTRAGTNYWILLP